MWRSEDNMWELVLSFYHAGFRSLAWIIRVDSKHLDLLLTHPISPHAQFIKDGGSGDWPQIFRLAGQALYQLIYFSHSQKNDILTILTSISHIFVKRLTLGCATILLPPRAQSDIPLGDACLTSGTKWWKATWSNIHRSGCIKSLQAVRGKRFVFQNLGWYWWIIVFNDQLLLGSDERRKKGMWNYSIYLNGL